MDLKGACLCNFYKVTDDVNTKNDSSTPKFVKIPHYQRPYKWDKENVKKLINDWAIESKTSQSYFSGSIVTVSNDCEHELIDGQQRFTTIFLANFILFLLCRVSIRQALNGTKFTMAAKHLEHLRKAQTYLFKENSNNHNSLTVQLTNLIDRITDLDSDGDDQLKEEILETYCKIIGLPNIEEENPEYSANHLEKFKKFLSDRELILTYDREYFNGSLQNILAKCRFSLSDQSYPKFHIDDINDDSNTHERKYADALITIVNEFECINGQDNPLKMANGIIKLICKFLEEISLCVIQTGNTRDAYTLFEVLNDRSLALDDLDLIKNLFYKTYVLNSNESDEEIDKLLQTLDEQWIDNIFGSCPEKAKKLIAYLSTVYITGSTELLYNKGDGYRSAISNYLNKKYTYSKEDIQRDFNIFHACALILKESDYRYKQLDEKALKVEFSDNSTLIKTIHFLNAMKQIGVLSGLINIVLKYIETQNEKGSKQFSPSLVRKTLKQLFIHTDKSSIQEQAFYFWQTSILAEDASIPRQYAIDIIENNNLNSVKFSPNKHPVISLSNNIESFDSWIEKWNYNDPKACLKAKILFSKLITLEPTSSGFKKQTIKLSISENDVAKLQLDHMEPSKIDKSRVSDYFIDDERQLYVNGLGNMMPLPSAENIEKSNTPLNDSFGYYEKAKLPSYLITESRNIFIKNMKNNIPTQQFFTERKELLKNYFTMAIEFKSFE